MRKETLIEVNQVQQAKGEPALAVPFVLLPSARIKRGTDPARFVHRFVALSQKVKRHAKRNADYG